MTTTATMPRHPDTIADLAPDCRRVLREEYQRIQTTQAASLGEGGGYDNTRSRHHNSPAAKAERVEAAKAERGRAIQAAVAEYRRVAAMWGVEV